MDEFANSGEFALVFGEENEAPSLSFALPTIEE
jgi:hypothetical protein